ncbi:hypothetical protein GY45DRAFT_1335218 [Cubamyces sp. BRFM 1775]|nr:hypothetical protein GY45DRAFT_1335218 [Cubamyces sp. BRFM 1775]
MSKRLPRYAYRYRVSLQHHRNLCNPVRFTSTSPRRPDSLSFSFLSSPPRFEFAAPPTRNGSIITTPCQCPLATRNKPRPSVARAGASIWNKLLPGPTHMVGLVLQTRARAHCYAATKQSRLGASSNPGCWRHEPDTELVEQRYTFAVFSVPSHPHIILLIISLWQGRSKEQALYSSLVYPVPESPAKRSAERLVPATHTDNVPRQACRIRAVQLPKEARPPHAPREGAHHRMCTTERGASLAENGGHRNGSGERAEDGTDPTRR